MAEVPTNPYGKRGEVSPDLEALEAIALPLQELANQQAVLMAEPPIPGLLIGSVKIIIEGKDELSGTIHLQQPAADSGISIEISGKLGEGLPQYKGTPIMADYIGEWYWRPTPDSPDFVNDGQRVRQNDRIGWAIGESKEMQWAIRADEDGIVHMVAPHGSKVAEETILFYIEGKAK